MLWTHFLRIMTWKMYSLLTTQSGCVGLFKEAKTNSKFWVCMCIYTHIYFYLCTILFSFSHLYLCFSLLKEYKKCQMGVISLLYTVQYILILAPCFFQDIVKNLKHDNGTLAIIYRFYLNFWRYHWDAKLKTWSYLFPP